jgi:hypothetical protein
LAAGGILLGHVAKLTEQLAVACPRCDWASRVSTARLLAQHSPNMPMTDLRRVLAGGCPRLNEDRITELFGVHYPELPRLLDMAR